MITEIIGNSTLILGDCLEVLPIFSDNFAHWAVTSPPYNLNKLHSGHSNKEKQSEQSARMEEKYDEWYADELEESVYQAQQKEVITELMRVCSESIFYNHRIRYVWHNRNKNPPKSKIYHPLMWLQDFPIWSELIWDRAGGGLPHGRHPLAHEYIYQIKKPSRIKDVGGMTSVLRISPVKNSLHVCPFPTKLVKSCLSPWYKEGDIVIDPFMGAATVGIVAEQLGMQFIGIEKDPKIFEGACINIEQNYKYRNMVNT